MLDYNHSSSGSGHDKLTIDDIATVARSSNEDPSLSPSVAKVADQLIDSIGQMVEKDMRTPPKLKEDIKNATSTEKPVATTPMERVEANGRFKIEQTLSGDSSEGKAASAKKEERKEDPAKGVAVPVIMEEDAQDHSHKKLQKIPDVEKPQKDDKKKVASTTAKPARETLTTTSSSGLSTWILLSDNREATTPQSSKKKTTTTTKKPAKAQVTTVKPGTSKPANKKTTPKPEKKSEPVSALETMVKNKNSATTRPVLKRKEPESEKKKITTIPPAILVETTEATSTEAANTESSLETTTKKKKTSTKKRKKNKNRRKKPAEKSGEQEIKDLVKQPKQPVGAQFYNFLSREIMPTVGLGLVGVLVTAGLAGLLGYNPFIGANIPVRRTYESQHGYHPHHSYYNYNTEYTDSDGGGKNEEVLFREVLSGMPEDSRYGIPSSDVSYPESQLYNSQEQAYDAVKNPAKKTENTDGYSEYSQYDSYTNKEDIGKYPVYSSGSYVYPEKSTTTEKFKASAKYSDETIEKQPEALYRVSSDYNADDAASSDSSWHRIGSPMDHSSQASHLEPGPRRLDLSKMTEKLTEGHKRSKRSPEGILARIVRRSNEVASLNREDDRENEIDGDDQVFQPSTEESVQEPLTTESSTEGPSTSTEEGKQPSLIDSFPSEATPSTEKPPSLLDVLRKLAQFKLRLGINFLKATTDAFGKYLEGVQQRVEDSYSNDTSLPALRFAWMGRDTTHGSVDDSRVREKRYQRAADGESSFLNNDQDPVMES